MPDSIELCAQDDWRAEVRDSYTVVSGKHCLWCGNGPLSRAEARCCTDCGGPMVDSRLQVAWNPDP